MPFCRSELCSRTRLRKSFASRARFYRVGLGLGRRLPQHFIDLLAAGDQAGGDE